MKIKFIFNLLFLVLNCYLTEGQHRGGSDDGWSKVSSSGTSLSQDFIYKGGFVDGWSSLHIVVLGPPSASAATNVGQETFTANWVSVSGATGYYIDVSASNTFSTLIPGYNNLWVGNVTSYQINPDLTPGIISQGTVYYYRIRASDNISGPSGNSNVVSLTTVPPAPVANPATSLNQTTFQANWNSTNGASAYYLDVSASNTFDSFISVYGNMPVGNVTTYLVNSGLSPGATYYYRVRASNASGTSGHSATVSLVTEPAQSTGIVFSATTINSTTVNFTNGNGTSRLLVARQGAEVNTSPVDGTTYSGNNIFSNGSEIGTGNYVVGIGAGPITVTGLTQETSYYFRVFEFNGAPGAENYNPDTSPGNPASHVTETLKATLTEVAPGSFPVVSADILTAGATDQVLTGFSITSNGSQLMTSVNFNISGLGSQVSNIRLFKSATASNVGSQIAINSAGNFTGLSENITTTVYYYLVANVFPSASVTSPSLALDPSDAEIIFSSGEKTSMSISRIFTFKSSQTSDIILNGGSSPLIAYGNYQGSSVLTNGNSLSLSTFTIRDGAGVSDTDNQSTIMTEVTFQFSSFSNLRRVAIFDGSANLGEQDITSGSVTFSGLSISAADNTTKDFTVRATFKSTVTDNESIEVSITEARASTSGSGFAAADAGGPTTGAETNQINVIAEKLRFVANPPDTPPNSYFNLVVGAVDALGNIDRDQAGQVTLSASGGSGTLAASLPEVLGPHLFNGVFLWTKLSITEIGTYVLTCSYTGLSNATGSVKINAAAEPTIQASNIIFSSVTFNSITLNFTVGNGASKLLVAKSGTPVDSDPVDGNTYTANSFFGDGPSIGNEIYVVGVGSGPFTINGLNPATIYYFRVYEFNGTPGVENYNSAPATGNPASQTTLSSEPAAQAINLLFSPITTTTTNVTITPAAGNPDGYLVLRKADSPATGQPSDGVVYTNGTSLEDGTVVYDGNADIFQQTGLASNSLYYYTVFSYNGSGTNINYLINSPFSAFVLTLPDPPVSKPATNNSSTLFDANWEAISGSGAVTYEVDVSKDNFSTIEKNFSALTATTVRVNNLTASTDYKYRVRAVNSTGISSNSVSITARTSDPPGNPLKINTTPSSSTILTEFNQSSLSANVTGGTGSPTVQMNYRSITAKDFNSLSLTDKGNNNFEVAITETMMDELGLEFVFEATDQDGTIVSQPSHSFLYKSIDASSNVSILFATGFNGKTNTYQMFSIPYELKDKDLDKLFDVALNGYDNTQWRLFHYENSSYKEYPNQFRQIRLGDGYWFNTIIKDFQIKLGDADVAQKNQDEPFVKQLQSGWNQIGNPYPFTISWSAVLGGEDRIGSLQFFKQGGYLPDDLFRPWTGAFVHADAAIPLLIPVTAKTSASGRTKDNDLQANLDAEQWLLPITLRIHDLHHTSGVGMHPQAKASKDKFDEITVPRFLDYAEMNTYHQEFFSPHFSTDIVPTNEDQVWIFDIKSNLEEHQGEISWDYSSIATNNSSLILIDLLEGKWVDMKTTGSYTFTQREGRQFKVLYNREGDIKPGMTLLGEAYPNPFTSEVRIPLLIDEPGLKQIEIYDGFGRLIQRIRADLPQTGINEIIWDTHDINGQEISSGMFYYRLLDIGAYKVKRLVKK